jgi:predicted dehydrogenase
MTDLVRVLVIGVGRAGMVHARDFAAGVPGGRLAAVCDPDADARERASVELDSPAFSDPVAAATDDGIDAVVIASPTFTHAEIALAALRAGKHVLCEKPLAANLVDARAVVDAAAESAGSFSMGFMRRFDHGFRGASERIARGDIGTPLLVRSTCRGPGLPPSWAWDTERSGGMLAEVNSHDLDTVRWLSGQEFDAVSAVGRAAKRPDIAERYPAFVDVAVATFELDGGGLAQVDGACPADYGYDARAEVYGTAGAVFVGSPSAGDPLLVTAEGSVQTATNRSWRDLFAPAYRAEDARLVAIARGEAEPAVDADDGLRALEAVVAANRSMAEGRRVRLSEVTMS